MFGIIDGAVDDDVNPILYMGGCFTALAGFELFKLFERLRTNSICCVNQVMFVLIEGSPLQSFEPAGGRLTSTSVGLTHYMRFSACNRPHMHGGSHRVSSLEPSCPVAVISPRPLTEMDFRSNKFL
ncbi:hypothetical protein AVEN_145178-1 [Araneus ventricosus]|uniref:Uncharacterized protein n=1 Tax=Araneus ventricosus TaxID=182803 RepID=A0A4Y2PLB4_ARAVE|nr:hypothetical protein AVEN_145178-1 [Araneus ventricosus]